MQSSPATRIFWSSSATGSPCLELVRPISHRAVGLPANNRFLALAWFCYDFVTYPFGLFSSTIVEQLMTNNTTTQNIGYGVSRCRLRNHTTARLMCYL